MATGLAKGKCKDSGREVNGNAEKRTWEWECRTRDLRWRGRGRNKDWRKLAQRVKRRAAAAILFTGMLVVLYAAEASATRLHLNLMTAHSCTCESVIPSAISPSHLPLVHHSSTFIIDILHAHLCWSFLCMPWRQLAEIPSGLTPPRKQQRRHWCSKDCRALIRIYHVRTKCGACSVNSGEHI